MRITDAAIINDFLTSISRSKGRINRLNMQLSSQQRLLKVSDEPTTASTLLRLNEDKSRVAKYKDNVVDGQNSLKMTADGLDKVSDLIGEVKKILTGAVSSGDQSLLGKLADQVDQFLSLGLEIANTQFDRKYIFGGTATTDPPFVRTGVPTQISYQGDARSIQYQVGDGVSQIVNVSGAAAFTSTGFMDLSGVLDNTAAVNTVVNQTATVTDANGVAHNITLTMRKTDTNAWAISAALPPGATDANLTGGTATVTFDPATGQMKDMVRGAALVLSPTGVTPGQTAPPMNLIYSATGLSEGTIGGGSTLAGSQRNVSLFNKMIDISTSLRNGVRPSADDMALLSVMQDVVMREVAKAGAYSSNLSTANSFLTAQYDHLESLYASKQGIDDVGLAEIGIRLSQEQTMLDAALSSAAKLIPKSLVDFLK
jgi:flagellar hook-associated protein 3